MHPRSALIIGAALFCGFFAMSSASQAGEDVLSRVRHNNQVRCAVDLTPGFSQINDNGEAAGFDVDFCRAVAAAALGDARKISTQRISTANKYKAVSGGEVDLGLGMSTWTLNRDTALGTHFPAVIFNDGQGFAAWGDSGVKHLSDAKNASVCVQTQTTSIDTLKSTIARNHLSLTLLELPSSEE